MDELSKLALLLSKRNFIDEEIGAIIGRPASTGHIGEYIAAEIFNIELLESATEKGIDGLFKSGSPLENSSVNVKFYLLRHNSINISAEAPPPDYYLVLRGPTPKKESSRGSVYPLGISSIHLFHSKTLIGELTGKVKVGMGSSKNTSVAAKYWDEAELYPSAKRTDLVLCKEQIEKLDLFSQ